MACMGPIVPVKKFADGGVRLMLVATGVGAVTVTAAVALSAPIDAVMIAVPAP